MKMLRTVCVLMVVAGLAACGGAPSESPASVDSTEGAPQPTAVFSDDFETGETEDWQAGDEEAADAETEEAQAQPE